MEKKNEKTKIKKNPKNLTIRIKSFAYIVFCLRCTRLSAENVENIIVFMFYSGCFAIIVLIVILAVQLQKKSDAFSMPTRTWDTDADADLQILILSSYSAHSHIIIIVVAILLRCVSDSHR